MAKKKRYRGHFCKVCRKILPNEKFSGKGRAAHICKKCTRRLKARKSEEIAITRIHSLLLCHDLSQDDRKMLENYTHSSNERVRLEARVMIYTFTGPAPSEEAEDFSDVD